MYKREGLAYKSLLYIYDLLVIGATFFGAHLLRFASPELIGYAHVPSTRESLILLAFVVLSWSVVFKVMRLYQPLRGLGRWAEVVGLFKSSIIAFLLLVSLTYFLREIRYSRLVLFFFALLCFVVMVFTRYAARRAIRRLVSRTFDPHRILIIGAGELARKVSAILADHPEMGLKVLGFMSHDQSQAGSDDILGAYEDVNEQIKDQRINQVIIALPMEQHHRIGEILERLKQETVDIKVVPDLVQYITLCGTVEEFGGLPIIGLQGSPMNGLDRFVKRAFDLVVSSLSLVILFIPLLILALLVKLTSKGPVFYRQERMGLDGRTFTMLKFRTMRLDAEKECGEVWAAHRDPRCTTMGRAYRRLSLDELPQLFNVLKGDMSLVGPRPERPVFIENFNKSIPKYHLRHKVKAGITGWAQVNGLRGRTSLKKRIEYDLFYIENWSLAFDIRILFKTAVMGFWDRGGGDRGGTAQRNGETK